MAQAPAVSTLSAEIRESLLFVIMLKYLTGLHFECKFKNKFKKFQNGNITLNGKLWEDPSESRTLCDDPDCSPEASPGACALGLFFFF